MKIKSDFVTNSSSTSFTFIFEGDKRTDLFRTLVKYESDFKILYHTWDNTAHTYDVWDLIECLINLIKRDINDKYYLPTIYPISKIRDDINRELEDYERCLEEMRKDNESLSSYNYMKNVYVGKIQTNKERLKVLDELINKNKKISAVEISFGNDGIVTGTYGYAFESELHEFKQKEDLNIFIESNH